MADLPADRLDGRFARRWAAGTTSALGSGLATIAAPLLVAARTDDPLTVSAAAVSWLPGCCSRSPAACWWTGGS